MAIGTARNHVTLTLETLIARDRADAVSYAQPARLLRSARPFETAAHNTLRE